MNTNAAALKMNCGDSISFLIPLQELIPITRQLLLMRLIIDTTIEGL
jgi:hypothetical protein